MNIGAVDACDADGIDSPQTTIITPKTSRRDTRKRQRTAQEECDEEASDKEESDEEASDENDAGEEESDDEESGETDAGEEESDEEESDEIDAGDEESDEEESGGTDENTDDADDANGVVPLKTTISPLNTLRRGTRKRKHVQKYTISSTGTRQSRGRSAKRSKHIPVTQKQEGEVKKLKSVKQALAILERSKRHKITVINLLEDSDDDMVDTKPTPLSTENSVVDDIASQQHLHRPLEYGTRCECGMLLLDSDQHYTTRQLNKIIRQQNVSVLVLRSKSRDGKTLAEKARLGAFADLIEKEWRNPSPSYSGTTMKWTNMKKRLGEEGGDMVRKSPAWDVFDWVTPDSFKSWWCNTVESIFEGTTWPFECGESLRQFSMLTEEEMVSMLRARRLKIVDGTRYDCKTADIISLCFGVLVGGWGSPPHIDTHHNMLTGDTRTSMAVGYIVQGIKYFWTLPPKGGYGHKFVRLLADCKSPGLTEAQLAYRQSFKDVESPHPFQGTFSMGWPSVSEWAHLSQHVPGHFHIVQAEDRYIISDGSFHGVANHPRFPAAAIACDDDWIGSSSDFQALCPRESHFCA